MVSKQRLIFTGAPSGREPPSKRLDQQKLEDLCTSSLQASEFRLCISVLVAARRKGVVSGFIARRVHTSDAQCTHTQISLALDVQQSNDHEQCPVHRC